MIPTENNQHFNEGLNLLQNESIENNQDGDGSKTTYESFSSQSEEAKNDNELESPNKDQSQQFSDNKVIKGIYLEQDFSEEKEPKYEVPQIQKQKSIQHSKRLEIGNFQEVPLQCRTFRISNLNEGKLIQFEEYEPFNNSNKNDNNILTGGRLASCASNSNRFSLSKTFNFQFAFNGNHNQDENEESSNKSSQIQQLEQNDSIQQNSQKESEIVHNELTERVDAKIRQIAEEYNLLTQNKLNSTLKNDMGTQTFDLKEIMEDCNSNEEYSSNKKSLSFKQTLTMDEFNQTKTSQNQFKSHQKRNQSHETHQSALIQTILEANNLTFDQDRHDFNSTLNDRRTSQMQRMRLFERISQTQNRTMSSSQTAQLNQHNLTQGFSFHNHQQNMNQPGQVQGLINSTISESKIDHSYHERQWSASSSSLNQNNMGQQNQPFNGVRSMSFNRTLGTPHIQNQQASNKKKREDNLMELKFMLDNVQCEAKNLKLLLNLKDDQLQMIEAKNQDITMENEDLQNKIEKSKERIDLIEEENLYLRAIINSSNMSQNQIQKINQTTNTDQILQINQQCQATFPSIQIAKAQNKSIALSPTHQDNFQREIEIEMLKSQVNDQNKENFNLINTIGDQAQKINNLESENSILQQQVIQYQLELQEMKKQISLENNNFYWQLDQYKKQLIERDQKMVQMLELFEETKHQIKRKSLKIKNHKKERDALRIEILKLKQIYSDKCDNYKDTRHKLQRKVKKRDDIIQKLEEKIMQYEKFIKNNVQATGRPIVNSLAPPDWSQNYLTSNTGKFCNELDQSSQLNRSSMSSRSLENTRNLNSTAKGALKGINQMLQRVDQSKEQSQNVKDLLGSSNQHNTSLSNPPKSKNLTPGSLPSGVGGIQGNNYNHTYEEYQREKAMKKLKSHYKKLDLEEEKNIQTVPTSSKVQNYVQYTYQPANLGIYNKNLNFPQFNNHYVSNDKSKSFYSSDIENNALFDQNHIVDEQSNSSNFFSNINNSNSHLYLDDSAIAIKSNDLSSNFIPKQTEYDKAKYLTKNASNNQFRNFADQNNPISQQMKYSNIQVSNLQQQFLSNNQVGTHPKRQPSIKLSADISALFKPPQTNQSLLQSIQPEEIQKMHQQQYARLQTNPSSNMNQVSKSPISKNHDSKKQQDQQTMIQRNRSSQNLSQGELQNKNTQESIRVLRNDSATSSNRNLHQVKDNARPPSTSSTNNTSGIYQNQIAMVSYQSSSSGGSKQYQSKTTKNKNQQQQQPQNYIPYYNSKQSTLTQNQPIYQSSIPIYSQVSQSIQANKQSNMINTSYQLISQPISDKIPPNVNYHRRQRSKQGDSYDNFNEEKQQQIMHAQANQYQVQHNSNDLKNVYKLQTSFNY